MAHCRDLAEGLASAVHSLREQEVVARNLATAIAQLSAETEKISVKIKSKAGITCCSSQSRVESVKQAPRVQPADMLPCAVRDGGSDGLSAATAVRDDTAWARPESFGSGNGRIDVDTCMTKFASWRTPTTCSRFINPSEGTTELLQCCADEAAKRRSQTRVFSDPEEFRERIRLNLIEERYKPEDFFKESGWPQRVVRHNWFEATSLALVLFSCIWIAIDMDLNDNLMLHEAKLIFQVVSHLLCMLFFLELLIRCLAFKRIVSAFKDCWCLFDMVLVSFLVCEVWVFGTVAAISGRNIAGGSLKLIIVFRVLRLSRVFRLARVLRGVPELMVIVRGLGIASRAIVVVLLLLGGIIYVGAIVFRGMLEGSAFGAKWFPTVLSAMGTLMLECTLSGARGTPLIREAHKESIVYSGLLLCFVLLANVTMMGVLAGLLVQTVKTVAESEKEEKSVRDLINTMDELWCLAMKHDEDRSGTIDEIEFRNMLSVKETALILRHMDVDVEGMASVCGFLFEQNSGRLTRKAFLELVLDLRGSQKATVKDHIETRKFVHAALKQSQAKMTFASFDVNKGTCDSEVDEV